MKALLLAGGNGTRLYPLTNYINKHLLPIAGLPMIYYPISFLIMLGVTEFLININPKDKEVFYKLLGDGSDYGLKFDYIIQEKSGGLAEPLLLADGWIKKGEKFVMMLGDNLFYVPRMKEVLADFFKKNGATIVITSVEDSKEFGVVEINHKTNQVISLEEKPENPKSNYIATGLYCYDYDAIEFAKQSTRSKRGELEITDINNKYLENNKLNAIKLERTSIWFDCGTQKLMEISSEFVYTVQKNHNISKIGVIEECCLQKGLITIEDIERKISRLKKSDYREYLEKIVLSYKHAEY